MITYISNYKKIFSALVAGTLLTMSACTNLDVENKSQYSSDNFTTEEQYIAASGSIYVQLRDQMARNYWFIQELSTDEAIITTRDGNWYDGGTYVQLNNHTWNPSHSLILGTWQWAYKGINVCNNTLNQLNSGSDNSYKKQFIAESRTMRALYHFFLLDLFGNVAIIDENTTTAITSSRKEVFDFIEQELKESISDLSTTTGSSTYGRPTQWMAYALLAKLYLNAEVYTGTSRYTEAIEACNAIIDSGKSSLNSDYMAIFGISNGPSISEIIFAVPYDGTNATGQYFARYYLHSALKTKYGLPFTPSNAMRTWKSFFDLCNNTSDLRYSQWLVGKQYNTDGTPVTISTTKVGLDDTYSGSDGSTKVTYQLEFTDLTADLFEDASTFELGGDELSKAIGVRNIKYYPDNTVSGRDQSNDFVLFRYADILLMKAEAILRGGTDSKNETAVSLVNEIRTRAKVEEFSSVDLQTLYEERSREMAWEGWRRNDMIRFGKWEDAWGLKTNTETYRRIFPIPTNELSVNTQLEQNPGY